jgi:WD40-like Beta Propeller Repeat
MKSRREILIDLPLALLGATVASHAQPRSMSSQLQSPSGPNQGTAASQSPADFAQLHFLTFDPNYSDYRPAIDVAAQHVVFERTPASGGITTLYILALSNTVPLPFIQESLGGDLVTGPTQTRPDWSWQTGEVVLNVSSSNGNDIEVLIAQADGTPLRNVPQSKGYVYPTWSLDGMQLIVYNDSSAASPRPCTSLIMLDGSIVQPNLDGNDADGAAMFGGFASPTPVNVNLIAYAGQPDIPWGPAAEGGYNQDFNYVFLNSENGGMFTSAPLEPNASITIFDQSHQGRASVWSPDGNYVAFESNRAGGYAIFLANVAAGTAPKQITDASYGAQHAKFFPDGTKLVLTALQAPGSGGPRGIAWVDISPYL